MATYWFSNDTRQLIISVTDDKGSTVLNWIDIEKGNTTVFWKGAPAEKITINDAGNGVAFFARSDSNNSSNEEIWYFQKRYGYS